MDRLFSLEQLQSLLGEVRKQRFITNFYLDPYKHGIWIAKGDCYVEKKGETLFVIRQGDGFWNVYFSSTNLAQFALDIKELVEENSGQIIMVDIVGRNTQCLPIVEMMKQNGFNMATSLVRMTKMTEEMECVCDTNIRKASKEDLSSVSCMLHEYFNAKTEQIPYDEELMEYIGQGHVLVCQEHGVISGFLVYEMNASTLYLRYWFTHPDYRDRKVGSRLLRQFFEEGKHTKRQLLWVIRTNENAIVRYKHYGFNEENMYDYVMSKGGGRNT